MKVKENKWRKIRCEKHDDILEKLEIDIINVIFINKYTSQAWNTLRKCWLKNKLVYLRL